MLAKSKAQQEYMAIQLAKKKKGHKTDVNMTEAQLEEFARTKRKGLPTKVKKEK